MPEETNTTPETPASDAPQGQAPAAETEAEAKTFSEDYVKALRDENAKWRKQVRDFESRLTEFEKAEAARKETTLKEQQKYEELAAQYAKERDELKAKLEQQALDLLRTQIATEYALPAALAARLVGKTEDELRADAESLKGLIPAPTPAAPAAASAQAPATRPQTTTTPIPTGTAGETDAQRRARLFGATIR